MISRSTSAGAAPNQLVVTVITGFWTSGASWMGMLRYATRPSMMTISTIAETATGRWMASLTAFIQDFLSTVTFCPSRRRSLPRTTTSSPGSSPSSTTKRCPTAAPSFTAR